MERSSRLRTLIFTVVALVTLWCAKPTISAAFKNVQVSQIPPAFTLKDVGGKQWKSAEIYGKAPTVVIFWATWSPRDHEALYQVAAVSLQGGKFAEAGALFTELLTEFPEREEFALGAALAAKYQGKDAEYRAGREAAAKLFPAEPRYIYELGGVAESQKDAALAAEFYRRALEAALKTKK